jgi:hypothetical protein
VQQKLHLERTYHMQWLAAACACSSSSWERGGTTRPLPEWRNLMHRPDTMGGYRVLTQYGSMAEGIRKISAVGQRSMGGPVRQSFSAVNHPIVRYRGRFGIGCEQADFPADKMVDAVLEWHAGPTDIGRRTQHYQHVARHGVRSCPGSVGVGGGVFSGTLAPELRSETGLRRNGCNGAAVTSPLYQR